MTRPFIASSNITPPEIHPDNESSATSITDLNTPTTIYIGRLSISCSIQHLFSLLSEYADVLTVVIPDDHQVTYRLLLPCCSQYPGLSEVNTTERIAVATISSMTYAEQLVRTFDGHLFMGRFLR